MPISSRTISSLSRKLSILLPLSLLFLGSVDLALAGGRFPRRVSTPNGLGKPRAGTTIGGGVRSPGDPTKQFCSQSLQDSPNITALIPASDSVLHTLNPDPLVLIYIPPLPEESSGIASLTIANAEGDLLSQTTLDMPRDGGLIAFALPTEVLPLVDQTFYQWDLQVACQAQVTLDDPNVSGWIAYQDAPVEEPSAEQPSAEIPLDLETENALNRIDELSEAGYWLDAVLETANLLNTVDPEIRDAEVFPRLETLLKEEELDSFAAYFLD